MREKVVPIPFLGKEVSAWLYRTTRRVREHPYRAASALLAVAAGSVLYEANVTHKNRIPSPNVKNHLEYELRPNGSDEALFGHAGERQLALPVLKGTSHGGDSSSSSSLESATAADALAQDNDVLLLSRMQEVERLLMQTKDPEKRAELERIIAREKEKINGRDNTTMRVTNGQLYVREPHWNIRNNERNWSILARDQQQQKDHYWYRLERSREDDFARNTYSRP